MTEVKFKRKNDEYKAYIIEHIKLVKVAFTLLESDFRLILGDTLFYILQYNIEEHDKSKFSTEEFESYIQWFYPNPGEKTNKEMFDKAWEHHYKVNDHHPEHWVKNGIAYPMSALARAEMFCDWLAMSIKFNTVPSDWYWKHEKNEPFNFNSDTRKLVENFLPILDAAYDTYKMNT